MEVRPMKKVTLWLFLSLFVPCAVACGVEPTWSLVGALEIERTEFKTPEPSKLKPGRIGMQAPPCSRLFVDGRGDVYVNMTQDEGYNRPRRLKEWEWSFCEMPKMDVAETSYTAIESGLPRRDISNALYKNLLEIVKIPHLIQELRSAPDWETDSYGQRRQLEGNAGEDEIKRRLRTMAQTTAERSVYLWVETPGGLYGIIEYSYEVPEYNLPEQPTFVRLVREMNAPPQLFYRTKWRGKNVILIHNFGNDYFTSITGGNWNRPGLFFFHKDRLFLVSPEKITVISTKSEKAVYYDLPVRELPSVAPAFFHKGNELYVLGVSRMSDGRVDILKCDLADVEKAEGP
jgi:hypothetical protein